MARYSTKNGSTLSTDKALGAGGEGTVYSIVGQPHSVAKIYHTQRLTKALADKVAAMVADPPDDESRNDPQLKHVSIAWPEQILTHNGKFVGYVMPKIPKSDDLYDLLQPQQRAKQHAHADHRMIYRTARNFATAMAAIHRKKYVIGDVNFKNALFTDQALITIVDCDSMQVTDAKGTIHRCLVGLPEYTAPELQGADFGKMNRTTESDTFGLAVLIFQLLMQGFHPFAGRPLPGAPDVEQVHVYCIARNIFPYEQNTQFVPPNAAPPITALPGLLRALFQRAFTTAQRPSAKEWADALAMVESRLVQCPNDPNHYYPADGACVVCEVDINVGRRKRTSTTTQTTQMQVPYAAPKHVIPSCTPKPSTPTTTSTSTPFTLPKATPAQPAPTQPSIPVITPPSPASISMPAILTQLRQQRMTAIALTVIAIALLLMFYNWNSATSVANTDTVGANDNAITATQDAIVSVEDTIIPTAPLAPATATMAPTMAPTIQPLVMPACDSSTLLASFWPESIADRFSDMRVKNWPTRISDAFGSEITLQPIPAVPLLNGLTNQTLSESLRCNDGQIARYSLDKPANGAPLACDESMCADSLPLFREYSAVLYGGSTPSSENFVIGKSPIARFFAVTGSKARYTVIVFDNTSDDVEIFTKYQLPLIQHEYKLAKENDIQSISTTSAQTWYDVRLGIQTSPNTAILEQYQRKITIPNGLTWSNGRDVEAIDYQRWLKACAQQEPQLATCAYISDITILNKLQLLVTYVAGLPREMARIIQPYAISDNAIAVQASMQAQLLSDSMGAWRCAAMDANNSWQCETVSTTSSSNTKVITFYRYALLDDINVALAKPFDVLIASADVTPSFVTRISLQPDSSDYTLELVPTGAMYAVARQ